MISKSNYRKALFLLRSKGVGALARKLMAKTRSWLAREPSEHLIAFHVLKDTATARVMIDVGASTGITLAPFADAGWRVYAFEPDPRNRAVLERTFGDYPNVVIDPRAVSNEAREAAPFYSSEISLGISGLTPFHTTHRQTETVNITTLSAFLNENRISSVDLLKVDTEGHDLFVLQGFPWETIKPSVLICEFDDAKTAQLGYSWFDLASYLQGLDYLILVSEWELHTDYGGRNRWIQVAEFPCKLTSDLAWGNIIALKSVDMMKTVLGKF